MKKKTIVLFFTILCFILLLVGGSYAYWSWNSDKDKNLVFNTAKGLEEYIIYDEGDSYFIGNFQPVDSFCLSAHNTISFYKTEEAANVSLLASVKMNVNSIGENSSLSNDVYWIITSGDSNIDCNDGLNSSNVLNYGSFNGMSSGDVITLLSDEEVTLTEKKFTVWIWIDNASANLSSLSGETIDTNIWTQIDMIESESSVADGAASPVLDEGMIPVTISADGTVTTISKYDNSWYNYEKKEWANAILVNESSRSSYVNTSGVTVNNSDILAYYVWVPRYKYQVWTTTTSSQGNEQEIDIVFEPRDATYSVATAVGQYQTHPAFWWDNNSNGVVDIGELISGFWVGKFEATGTEDTPTILPNVTSLRNQNASTQFQTSLKFAGGTLNNGNVTFSGSDIYGLTSNTDSHMMKNSEWGAVAYLSHSKYGINGEIRINNNSNYTTGCGASVTKGSSSSTCEIAYGSATEYPQSTTGNITGIYDMSGGAFDCVMGVLSDSNGKPRSGSNTSNFSGFNGLLSDGTEYTSGISFPDSKYYDLYLNSQFIGTSSTNNDLCTLATCGGHALYETAKWYANYSSFVYSDNPWFFRGGYYGNEVYAGVFNSDIDGGSASSYFSWRSVLIFGETKIINYDANGGSGAPSSQEKIYGKDLILSDIIPTRTGYTFLGWSESKIATSPTYSAGGTYTRNGSTTLYAVWKANSYNLTLDYNGGQLTEPVIYTTSGEYTYTVPSIGTYQLEVWGAQGGYGQSDTYRGGYGGYSKGNIYLDSDTNLYINVGGQGGNGTSKVSTLNAGGYNGGGNSYGTTSKYVGSGGGATHIAKTSGILSSLSDYAGNNDSPILIVAGGGGGGAYESTSYTSIGGDGGGYIGVSGQTTSTSYAAGTGGTQTAGGSGVSAGSFGQGGNATSNSIGGGGGYYGGGVGKYSSASGGGSGYIANINLTNRYMYCYNCTTSDEESTKTYTTTNVSSTPITDYAKSGDGAARILKLSTMETIKYDSTYGNFLTDNVPTKTGYTFLGWNTKSDGSGEYVTENSIFSTDGDQILYAVFEIIKYTINYDANGGSGAPASQVKTYGLDLILSDIMPTRTNYIFLGWSESQTATSATYMAGEKYVSNKSTTLYAVWEGNSYNVTLDYNGLDVEPQIYTTSGEYTYTVSAPGTYQLEVWGAQGGAGMADGVSKYDGGYGGYSIGNISLNANDNLYINVGGKGEDASDQQAGGIGGYNGGGAGGTDSNYSSSGGNEPGAGGGGATHISLVSGELSTLSDYAGNNNSPILIVAGGGGGGAYNGAGGAGGGIEGATGTATSTVIGTQTSGNAFGLGKDGASYNGGTGGGGGGYYGGGTGTATGVSGAGGSGYIANNNLTNKYMYCYNCTTSDEESTKTYTTTNVSSIATSDYAKSGDGAAKIVKIDLTKTIKYGSSYKDILANNNPIRAGYTFLGWNTKSDGTGEYVTETSTFFGNSDQILYAIWKINTYTISYDANGGTGAPSSQIKTYGIDLVLSDVIPTNGEYVFRGWSESSTSTSPIYPVGGTYTSNKSTTLYAVWGLTAVSIPVFEYTGLYEVVDDDDNKIEDIDNYVGDWKIRFLTSGTLTFNVLNDAAAGIDVFLVGGGGAGGAAKGGYDNGIQQYQGSGGGGGAGGYTTTMSNQKIFENIVYEITVGAGAASTGETGEESSAFGFIASGGGGGSSVASNLYTASGGLGGSNGGTGAFKKNNGSSPGFGGQPGQGTTTREFGEPTGKLYSGGGAGGRGHYSGSSSSTIVGGEGGGGASNTAGTANTGGGGGGGSYIGSSIAAGSGGSGIVIIRNHRVPDYTKNPNLPTFTYTGVYEVVNDDGDILGANDENWKIRFLTSGTLTITSFNNANNKIDVFLVGGGGAGGAGTGWYNNSAEKYEGSGGAGGGGGYTTTSLNQELTENISYNIVVGSGGLSSGATGGESSAFGITALGGSGGGSANDLAVTTDGGLGGSNGGTGAYMNRTGSTPGSDGNFGQGITTREFGEPTGMLYAGGGAGGVGNYGGNASAFVSGGEGGGGSSNIDAIANTGGGGGGGSYVYSGSGLAGKSGGTGIVIIRNSRVEDYTKNPNLPIFTYTGVYEVVDDNGDSLGIDDENWKIRFLTSGTLTISSLNGASNGIDVFLVGGGGAGGASNGGYSNGASKYEGSGGGGGAGGYTTTSLNQEILENISYEIVVGAGGLSTGLSGGESSAFGFTASGGGGGSSASGIAVTSAGGTGGSNGGTGANMKTKGSTPGSDGTPGQDTTTREFGELSGILYAGGGAGGIGNYGGSASAFVSGGAGGGGSSNVAGVSNTGSGGGGGTCFYYGKTSGKPGGSGIVIIRNARS